MLALAVVGQVQLERKGIQITAIVLVMVVTVALVQHLQYLAHL
jgi:hypothetical protein